MIYFMSNQDLRYFPVVLKGCLFAGSILQRFAGLTDWFWSPACPPSALSVLKAIQRSRQLGQVLLMRTWTAGAS